MRTAIQLLEKICGFLDESSITVQDDPTPLYADGISLQPMAKKMVENEFVAAVREAKALIAQTPCRDCNKPRGENLSAAARASGRCNKCQEERDEYYAEKLRMDHQDDRRERAKSDAEEHGTYWNNDGRA